MFLHQLFYLLFSFIFISILSILDQIGLLFPADLIVIKYAGEIAC